MLSTREGVFADYDAQAFEREFGRYFILKARRPIADSREAQYLMRGKEAS